MLACSSLCVLTDVPALAHSKNLEINLARGHKKQAGTLGGRKQTGTRYETRRKAAPVCQETALTSCGILSRTNLQPTDVTANINGALCTTEKKKKKGKKKKKARKKGQKKKRQRNACVLTDVSVLLVRYTWHKAYWRAG